MTEPTEPIEAVIARLRHSTNLGWVDSADGHEGATVRVSDLSRLLDYVEGMRWKTGYDGLSEHEHSACLVYDGRNIWAAVPSYDGSPEDGGGWFWYPVDRYHPLTAFKGFAIDVVDEPLMDEDTGACTVTHWMPLPPPPVKGGAA